MYLIKKRYLLIFFAFVVYSFVGVMAKMAALSESGVMLLIFIGLEFLLLAVYAFIWQQVLKKFSLVTAMACKGIVVILSLVWAVLFFDESIGVSNILGSIIIVIGIYIVSTKEVENAE